MSLASWQEFENNEANSLSFFLRRDSQLATGKSHHSHHSRHSRLFTSLEFVYSPSDSPPGPLKSLKGPPDLERPPCPRARLEM